MKEKAEKLRLIVLNGRNIITDKSVNSYTLTPNFDFELIDCNIDDKNSIQFKSIDEAIDVLKESGVTMSKEEIKETITNNIGNVKSEFRLKFF